MISRTLTFSRRDHTPSWPGSSGLLVAVRRLGQVARTSRIVTFFLLSGGTAIASVPTPHRVAPPPPPRLVMLPPPFMHPAGLAGPAIIGGPAKQQSGMVAGKPILRHH
jgi:hypothetical protein